VANGRALYSPRVDDSVYFYYLKHWTSTRVAGGGSVGSANGAQRGSGVRV